MTARSANTTLSRLIAPLVKPSVFDFWAGHLNPAWSWERPLARVVARHLEAQGTVTLDLKANRHCAAIQPGQHINVSAEVNGRRVTRSYSPTRISRSGKRLSITVKQVDGGKLSQHLCRQTQVGDALEIGPAFGDMTLPPASAPSLFLAAGSGITPLMSLTRALDQVGLTQDLTLVYWARTRAELCFVAELRALAARQPRFKVHFVLTQEAQRLNGEHAERLNADLLATLVPDLAQRRVYACGPADFVDTARSLSLGHALSFVGEAFTPPTLAVTDALGTVRINLALSGRTLEVPTGQALLPALEAQGLSLPSGCRMGICNTCACPKQTGVTQNLLSGDKDDTPTSALRLCVSRACTDLTLDL
ncbi:MAG: ferredoxin reductase [Aquabacterium sp.]|uniref:ferredoxin reductase n=1 Tax=Aquabacterium sp. TaxID=1872578 RepID=UPI00271B7DED|nr:ferredoxin reductase [Aquabacterium sp.]MDO9003026.1 ferredoxin reductase [Aquabacterium sp.]